MASSSWRGGADAVMMGLFARAMWARRVLTSPPRTSHAARRRLPATRDKRGHSRVPQPTETVLRRLLRRRRGAGQCAGRQLSRSSAWRAWPRCESDARRQLAAALKGVLTTLFKASVATETAHLYLQQHSSPRLGASSGSTTYGAAGDDGSTPRRPISFWTAARRASGAER